MKTSNIIKGLALSVGFIMTTGLSQAAQPIVNVNQLNNAVSTQDKMEILIKQVIALNKKVRQLENQVNYLVNENSSGKVENLTQSLNSLRGSVEVNTHEIGQINRSMVLQFSKYDNQYKQLQQRKTRPSSNTQASSTGDLAYKQAYNAMLGRHYNEATELFSKYLHNYPRGSNADKAKYWQAELLLVEGKPNQAFKQFEALLKQYPKSDKKPKALLKLGIICVANGQISKAKTYFKKLIEDYPKTDSANMARKQLRSL